MMAITLSTKEFMEKYLYQMPKNTQKTDIIINISPKGYSDLIHFTERINDGKSNRLLSPIIQSAMVAALAKHNKSKNVVRSGSILLHSDALPRPQVLRSLHMISKDLKIQSMHSTSLSTSQVVTTIKRVLQFSDTKRTIPKYRELVLNLLDYDPSTMSYDAKNFVKTMDIIMSPYSPESKQKAWRENLGYKYQRIEPHTPALSIKKIHVSFDSTVYDNFKRMVADKHGGRLIGFIPVETVMALTDFYESIGSATFTKNTPHISPIIRSKLTRIANKLGEGGMTEISPKLLREFITKHGSKTGELKDARSIRGLYDIITYYAKEIRLGYLDITPFIAAFRE